MDIAAKRLIPTLILCMVAGATLVWPSTPTETYELRTLMDGTAPSNNYLYKLVIDESGVAKGTWYAAQYQTPVSMPPFRFSDKAMIRLRTSLRENQFDNLPNVIGTRRPNRHLYCFSTRSGTVGKNVYMYLNPRVAPSRLSDDEFRFMRIWSSIWHSFPKKSPEVTSESSEAFRTYMRMPLEGPNVLERINPPT